MAVEKKYDTPNLYQFLGTEVSRSYMNRKAVSNQIRVAIPASIIDVNYKEMTCSCQPLIRENILDEKGNIKSVNLPMLVDVPIVYPGSSYFQITFPLAKGDEGLVIFSDMCIDAWWQSGGIQNQFEERRHDLSDGFFIPSMMSQVKKPNTYSSTNTLIRSKSANSSVLIDGVNISTFKANYDLVTADFEQRISALESKYEDLDDRVTALEANP